jgi:Fe-S-cluster containining protein
VTPVEIDSAIRHAVDAAALRPDVGEAVAAVYGALQAEIDARRPVCTASGRCCRFEEYGHRLYVTTIELAAFVRGLKDRTRLGDSLPEETRNSLPVLPPASPPDGCPFQSARLCTAHVIRPFGCRVFFCDETATEWQHAAYERHHARLKRLHDELNVPYYYVEWRQALRAIGIAPSSSRPPVEG